MGSARPKVSDWERAVLIILIHSLFDGGLRQCLIMREKSLSSKLSRPGPYLNLSNSKTAKLRLAVCWDQVPGLGKEAFLTFAAVWRAWADPWLNAEIWHTCWESNVKNNYEVSDDPCPPCLGSGTFNIIQVTDDDGVVLDKLFILLSSWNLAHKLGIICIWKTFKISRMTNVLHVSSQKLSKTSESLMMRRRLLTHL